MAIRGVVLIGASTGAPRTHHTYLQRMPADLRAPIVVVQHMPPGPFIQGLLRYLREHTPQPCELATDGAPLTAGHVYVAEPGTEVRCSNRFRLQVVRPETRSELTPPMDVTFSSAARVFGVGVFVAMISGLHAHIDGLRGCQAVRRAGGCVAVTTPETTPVYSMVRHVRQARACDVEADLPDVLTAARDWLGGVR